MALESITQQSYIDLTFKAVEKAFKIHVTSSCKGCLVSTRNPANFPSSAVEISTPELVSPLLSTPSSAVELPSCADYAEISKSAEILKFVFGWAVAAREFSASFFSLAAFLLS